MNIVTAVDCSAQSATVIAEAARYARRLSADLWLIHVADPDPEFVGYRPGPQSVRDQTADSLRGDHRRLQFEAEKLRRTGLRAKALFVQGPIGETVINQAGRLNADLIIVGSHGHGIVHDVLIGSVSENILRSAACPILVVPTHGR